MTIIVSVGGYTSVFTAVQPGLPLIAAADSSNACMQSMPEHMLRGAAAAAEFPTEYV
jgi:hypothetical protein